MNIAICDDDVSDIEKIKTLLTKYSGKNDLTFSVSAFTSGSALLDAMQTEPLADIIFLDINMKDMDGLATARQLRALSDEVPIILVTAYMGYVLDGYKVRASRFLIKDDLDQTFMECMDDVCGELRRRTRTILLSCVEGEIRFLLSEIVLIETQGRRCIIHLEKERYHVYEKLNRLEERLREYGFLRIHQSYLVNMWHVRSINFYVLTLRGGGQLPIPRKRYREVLQAYTLYAGRI